MNNNQKTNPLLLIGAVVFVIAVVFWMLTPAMEHIADSNGPNDCSLATLTEAELLSKEPVSVGNLTTATGRISLPGGWELSDGARFSCDNFSGVYELLWADYILPSDFSVNVQGLTVESGNFMMYVVNNDDIVAVIEPGDDVQCLVEDLTGLTTLRIAGERASFSFAIPASDYDNFQHH